MAEQPILKRKKVALSVECKLAILDKMKQGLPEIRLAEQYGVNRSTIKHLK